MGTWGAGNFQSDGALGYIEETIDRLSVRVEAILDDTGGASDLDEAGESDLMPGVALIRLICESIGTAPPKPERVRRWRDDYLCIFDNQIGLLDPSPGYERERRAVIVETFDGLLALSLAVWEYDTGNQIAV